MEQSRKFHGTRHKTIGTNHAGTPKNSVKDRISAMEVEEEEEVKEGDDDEDWSITHCADPEYA